MGAALVPLQNITLGSAAASVTFGSIPSTFRDLRIVARTTSTTAGGGYIRFNGDTGLNYNSIWAYGTGGGVGSSFVTNTNSFSIFGMFNGNTNIDTWDLFDYSAVDKHKTMLNRFNSPQADGVYMIAKRWASTSAVTSIVLGASTGNFAAGSTFALYGVKA